MKFLIFNGSLKITDKTNQYHYINGIEIDSTMYAPFQVTYNANQDVWSGVWYEIDLSTDTQTTSNGVISDKPDSVGVVPTLDNFLNNISLGVTSADTTSLTLTSIGLIPADGNEDIIKSGDVVNVICSLYLAVILDYGIFGVALGSVLAQFSGLFMSIIMIPATISSFLIYLFFKNNRV